MVKDRNLKFLNTVEMGKFFPSEFIFSKYKLDVIKLCYSLVNQWTMVKKEINLQRVRFYQNKNNDQIWKDSSLHEVILKIIYVYFHKMHLFLKFCVFMVKYTWHKIHHVTHV
jgi:hypothetical protein